MVKFKIIIFCILIHLISVIVGENRLTLALDHKDKPSLPGSNNYDLQFSLKEQQWLKRNHTVHARVGSAPPLHFFDKAFKGISIDYLNLISKRAGFQVKYITGIPWTDALDHIKKHEKIDLILTIKRTLKREQFISLTNNYLFMSWVIFTRTDTEFIGGMADLDNKTISVERGYVMHHKLMNEFPNINLLVVESSREAIEAVASGKADAHVGNLTITTYIIQKNNLNNIKVAAPTLFDNHNQAMGIRNDWPELATIINKTFKSLTSEDHAAIRHRWLALRYEYGISKADILKWILLISSFSLIIVMVILIWNRKLKKEVLKRQKKEIDLKKSEEKYRSIFENAIEGFFQSTPDGRFISVNPAFARILGYTTPEEFISSTFDIKNQYYVNQEDWQQYQKMLEKNGSVEHFEFKVQRKDCSHIWISNSTRVITDLNGRMDRYEGNITDITERKLSEFRLRESEQRFRELFNNMGTGAAIYHSPDDGESFIFTDLNKSGLENAGKNKKDVIGREVRDVFSGVKNLGLLDVFQRVWETGIPENYPTSLYTDGKLELWVENYVCKLPFGELVAIYDDTTARKKAEADKKSLELQLQQAQKMETIGTLAGGIAHDFNNILFPIIGHTEMLLEDVSKDSRLRHSLDEIYTGAIRARELVKQILTFSRQEKSERKPMKMQPVIKEVLKLIRSSIPSTIEMKQDIQINGGVIKADPTQIHQIILNLSTNASHAMKDAGGELTIRLRDIDSTQNDIIDADMKPGIYSCLTIADTGTGMDKNLIKKIFEPFFTTKEPGQGTGMGLAVVHGIVKNMGGTIVVDSTPGKGTEFNIYIPTEKKSFEKHTSQPDKIIQGGKERILLVDDEEGIIIMEQQMLERLGYQVTSSTNSIEALETFRSNPDKFDLIITDMAMPNMPGDKLAGELTKIRPGISILLCTGFSTNMSEKKAASLGITDFLLKPIVMKDLSQKIREVLDKNNQEEPCGTDSFMK